MSAGGLVNSLVGKGLGGDEDTEAFIESYLSNLRKLVDKHKALRSGANGQGFQPPRGTGQEQTAGSTVNNSMALNSGNSPNVFSGNILQ